MAASYYEVLGVLPTASAEEIRHAYRQRARALHPDHQLEIAAWSAEGAEAALRAMQLLNEAWRVLGDRDRRLAYDRLRSSGLHPRSGASRLGDAADGAYEAPGQMPAGISLSLVRSLPWVGVLVVLGAIFVFTAFAAGGGQTGGAPSGSDLVGSCIRLERGGVVSKVPCEGPSDGRVDLVAVRASLCPDGADVVRLASEKSWLCLRDPSAG